MRNVDCSFEKIFLNWPRYNALNYPDYPLFLDSITPLLIIEVMMIPHVNVKNLSKFITDNSRTKKITSKVVFPDLT